MEETCVRKDVYDETLRRIEAMMTASEYRHEMMAERQERQIAEIRGEVKELREHVAGLENLVLVISDQLNAKQNKMLTLLTSLLAGSAVIIAAVQVFVALFK